MGVWSDYCLICGGPYRNSFYTDSDQIDYPDLTWLLLSYCITDQNKKFKTGIVDCGEAQNNDGKEFSTCPLHWEEESFDRTKAISCHRNCYMLLKKKFHYELKFSDVYNLLDEYIGVLKCKTIYGKMNKYSFGQEFDSDCVIKNKWLLTDPLLDHDNKRRILNIWEPFVTLFMEKKLKF
jgi:hypothetical protein